MKKTMKKIKVIIVLMIYDLFFTIYEANYIYQTVYHNINSFFTSSYSVFSLFLKLFLYVLYIIF